MNEDLYVLPGTIPTAASRLRKEVRTPGQEQAIAMQAGIAWALGCTGKFVWPIPDRGLRKRLHRISVPTLIIWGEDDRLNPLVYAGQFGQAITGSRVETIANCGHIPQVEQTDATLKLFNAFLS